MSDSLDLINTVRLHDNSISNQNRDLQYDLDKRAERIARKTGNAPLDWDEFNSKAPPQKEVGGFAHAANWGLKGGLVVAAMMLLVVGFHIATSGLATSIPIALAGAAGLGAAVGAVGGAFLSLIDDQKPEIRHEQLGKYKNYLDQFELSQGRAQSPGIENESSKWRDHADLSKQLSQDLTR